MKHINLDQRKYDVALEILDYVNQKLANKNIRFSLVRKISGFYLDMEEQLDFLDKLTATDSDLDDEPLGKPASCALGEACESCQ